MTQLREDPVTNGTFCLKLTVRNKSSMLVSGPISCSSKQNRTRTRFGFRSGDVTLPQTVRTCCASSAEHTCVTERRRVPAHLANKGAVTLNGCLSTETFKLKAFHLNEIRLLGPVPVLPFVFIERPRVAAGCGPRDAAMLDVANRTEKIQSRTDLTGLPVTGKTEKILLSEFEFANIIF